ncbi:Soyasapogenol B glucuronide galactosyltransferase [Glycine soja]|uniref:Soyasapogenol B glucuronide galactosyltransferase n=1 Tax=Glycine soja TaxID=3848 RepID=A0A445ITW9_GLYSO|nr:UDP-glucose flavonoid 3-O-glucosyltransferase 7 [Glycine soja]RZB89498.1 Soyasapogenol B glucuronide galactosyltransferase [Glycine soja]
MQPDFIVTDMFYPWFADAAADSESSVLPGLPHSGHANEEEEEGLLRWLDSKKEESVLYVSFGSMNKFPSTQLVEIAHALEDSGHDFDFIWVHNFLYWSCGDSLFESAIAGLPMVTWPIFAEQFFNEKFLVDVLRIGVSVGAKEWKSLNEFGSEVVKREDIGKTIALLMGGGEESVEMRRVKALSDTAKKAIQVGGSSHNNLKDQIEELKSLKLQKVKHKMEVMEKGDRNA